MKAWMAKALELLNASLEPPKHELNELDWKAALSPDKAGLQIELYGLPPIDFAAGPNHFKATLFTPLTFAQMSASEAGPELNTAGGFVEALGKLSLRQ